MKTYSYSVIINGVATYTGRCVANSKASAKRKAFRRHIVVTNCDIRVVVEELEITVEHVFPPIPIRDFDWCASADEETHAFGSTLESAINNLQADIES